MSTTVQSAFDEARDPMPGLPDDEPEQGNSVPGATNLAMHLLHEIAEDGLLRPSQRVRARRYLRKLQLAEVDPE